MIVNNVICSSIIRNWLGQMSLGVELRNGRSVLTQFWHRGPFYIQKPFYYEDSIPHIYLLHPPGGFVEGDQFSLYVNLGVGSRVLLTMPGSSKFYRSSGTYVYLQHIFNLSRDSILEWLPQSSIFFAHSKVIIDNVFTIASGARCIFFEMLCFDRNFFKDGCAQGTLNIFLSVSLNGSFGFRDRLRIDDSNDVDCYKFGGHQIGAMLFAVPGNIQILDDVRILMSRYGVGMGGATLLDNLLVVRVLGNDNEQIQVLLRTLWCFLRPIIVGEEPVMPRIWAT